MLQIILQQIRPIHPKTVALNQKQQINTQRPRQPDRQLNRKNVQTDEEDRVRGVGGETWLQQAEGGHGQKKKEVMISMIVLAQNISLLL